MIEPFLDRLPLVAILRGVTPEEVVDVSGVLVEAGFAIVEVPLNSPRPLESIERLHAKFAEEILIGAGTVMTPAQVKDVAAAGGRLIVMPHGDAEVVRAAKAAGRAGAGMSCCATAATRRSRTTRRQRSRASRPSSRGSWTSSAPSASISKACAGPRTRKSSTPSWRAGATRRAAGRTAGLPGSRRPDPASVHKKGRAGEARPSGF